MASPRGQWLPCHWDRGLWRRGPEGKAREGVARLAEFLYKGGLVRRLGVKVNGY